MSNFLKSFLSLICFWSLTTSLHAQDEFAPFEPLPVTEARNAAVGFALTQAAFAANIIATCKQSPNKYAKDPETVLNGWRNRNGEYVEAGYGWIMYVKALINVRQGQQAAESFKSQMLKEFATTGAATSKDMFSKGDPESVVCEKWLGFLSDERIDLPASAEFGNDLKDILTFHRAVLEKSSGR
jgi:hypothetical protein